MPATSPEALRRRHLRRQERRRERIAADPVFAARDRARMRAKEARQHQRRMARDENYRDKIRAKDRAKGKRKTAAKRAAYDALPFVGCDGEGIRRDGRSDYCLFRMGERELYRDGRRLGTYELLNFIVNCPPDQINVAFAFDYDVSNILRDVSWQRSNGVPADLEKILHTNEVYETSVNKNPYTRDQWTFVKFEGRYFGIKYIPRKFLKVCRGVMLRGELAGVPYEWASAIPQTERVIFDTFGFFAPKSFLSAIEDWNIGAEHRERIAANKARRAVFSRITDEIREYCRLECELLAQMMTAFRAVCLDTNIVPKTWTGAGAIASMLHARNGTIRTDAVNKLPAELLRLGNRAFYGGRFEVTRLGWVGKTWASDISSAYPHAMRSLPCMQHGRWVRRKGRRLAAAPADAIFVCPVAFEHPKNQFLCGLPFRQKSGAICWPRKGRGIYWSCELRSAERLGATISYGDGWLYQKRCDCQAFDWIEPLYEKRVAIGKGTKGHALKIGVNALYGKLAQTIGNPAWRNPIHAGLITATTRAMLNDAIRAAGQRNVIMLATDAIFTINKPAPVQLGGGQSGGLGRWEQKIYPRLFIVRPGLYWPPRPRDGSKWQIRSRGLSPKFFEPKAAHFEKAWRRFARAAQPNWLNPPAVTLAVPVFVGLKLAYRRGALAQACQWLEVPGRFSFAWHTKRVHSTFDKARRALILEPIEGTAGAHSETYDSAERRRQRQLELFELTDNNVGELLEAMPDPVELSDTFE